MRTAVDKVNETNTIFFIAKSKIPQNAKVTYDKFICDILLLETERHRTRLPVGVDRLEYEHDLSSPAVSLLDKNIKLNSVISDVKTEVKCCTADIRKVYLNNIMSTYRCMKIPI